MNGLRKLKNGIMCVPVAQIVAGGDPRRSLRGNVVDKA
jgi:hypothetical protein